jgi:sulfate permease, SulP family
MDSPESSAGSGTLTSAGSRLPALGGGALIGFIEVAFILSFASLVFAGAAPADFARGLGFMLIGAAVLNLVGARWSSMPGAVVMPQDTTTAIIAATSGAVLAGVDPALRFESMVLYLAVCGALTGLVMLILGLVRRGSLIRFIPLPVIGGFLAGTGYLLVVGGVDLITGGFEFTTASTWALAAGATVAVALLVWLRRRPSVVLVPAAMVVGVVAFFVILLATGTTLDEARALGLLPGSASSAPGLPFRALANADWSVVRSGLGGLLTVPLVATLGMLLNVSALEMVGDADSDLDRELRTVGGANLAASLTGTVAGYHGLGMTTLAYRMGVVSRLVPAVAAVVCLIAFLVGGSLISVVPIPVVGATVIFLGLGFLADWLIDARRQMTGPEVLMMAALVVAVATIGFIAAVAVGMIAAVIMFVVAYSRIDPVRLEATGVEVRSSLDRAPAVEKVLAAGAESIVVAELQGYLFFGTSKTVVEKVVGMVERAGHLSCLVVDMRHVDGADTTSVAALIKLARIAERRGGSFLVSQVPEGLRTDLESALSPYPNASIVVDLDHALEIAEDLVIGGVADPIGGGLEEVFGHQQWSKLRPLLEQRNVGAGEEVIRYGDDSASILMVEHGRIDTEIPTSAGWRRVRSSGPGTIVGEMSLYRAGGRTARVIATEDSVVFELAARAISEIEASDPALALHLHRTLAALLADRLAASNTTVASLLR